MPVSVNGNKATLSVKGFKRVNEFLSPELLDESELAILKNYVLDQVGGVPCLRNPLQSYNANALSAAPVSLIDVIIGSTDYLLAVDATILKKSTNGTSAWSNVKTGLTSSKIMRVCQWSGKLYCVNGFDAPFQTDLTTTANLGITKPDVSSVTVTPGGSGSIASGEYYYTIVYQDSNGNYSPSSFCLHASVTGPTGSVAFASLPTTYTKHLYRTKVGEGTFYLVAVIGDTTTTYTDTAVDTDLDLANALNYVNVPTAAYYPITKNDRLVLGNNTITPYNFPTFQQNNDMSFQQANPGDYGSGTEGLAVSSTYKWKMVLVFSDGSESEPVEISHTTAATPGVGGFCSISIQFKFPFGFSNVTGVKFYRTEAGGSTFYLEEAPGLVNPVNRASGTVEYSTSVGDARLITGSQLVAASSTVYGSRVVWSETGRPATIGALSFLDIFPDDGDVITGLVDDEDGIIIFKANNIYKLYTNGPPENWAVQKIVNGKGCSDPNTLVASPRGIFFNYRGHIYRWAGPGSLPEDVSLEFQTTLATVTTYQTAFYHAKDEWIVFPVVISSTDRFLIYDTKLNAWYNFSTGGTASAWAALSRLYGSDKGKLVLSVNTVLGWYTEPTGTAGIDTYPSSTAISGQIRTKTFTFPDGIPLLRPRCLWLNALVITSFSITHTLSDPDAGSSATVSQAATQTGVVRYITDAMTTAILSLGKVYYDMTGTYMTKFYGFDLAGTILNRGRRI